MVSVEVPVVVDVGIDGQGVAVPLILMKHRGAPIRIGPFLVEFRHLVIGVVLPVLLPVLLEVPDHIVGHRPTHGQSLCDGAEVPIRR